MSEREAEYSARNIETLVIAIPLEQITPSPYQRRVTFDETALQELADSIIQHGLMNPVTVRTVQDFDRPYQLIAGERRLRACRLAGLATIPALVREVDDITAAQLVALENLQRQDLTILEEAETYAVLMGMGMTQTAIGERLGLAQPTIANALRLRDLPEEVKDLVQAGALSASHGRALLKYREYPALQASLAVSAVELGISVKTLEGSSLPWDAWRHAIETGVIGDLSGETNGEYFPYEIRESCGDCPHKLNRYCLDPACMSRKLAEYQQREAETLQRATATAQAAGTTLPKLDALKYGTYERLAPAPAGCREDCEHRGMVLDGKRPIAICTKPKCYNRLKNAKENANKAASKARAGALVDRAHDALQQAQLRGDALTLLLLHRVLAIALAKAASSLTAKKITDAGARFGITLNGAELERCYHPQASVYLHTLADTLSTEQLLHLIGEMYLVDNLRSLESFYGAEMSETRFILGEKPPKEKAPAAEPTNQVRTCRVCGCTEEDCSGCLERTGEACSCVDDAVVQEASHA